MGEEELRSDLSQVRANFDLPGRASVGGIGAFGLLTGIDLVVGTLGSPRLESVFFAVGVFVSPAGLFAILGSCLLFWPGPRVLFVSSKGVSSGGVGPRRRTLVHWGDRRALIVLQDWRRSPMLPDDYLQRRTGVMLVKPSIHGFDISVEAFEAIATATRTAGLQVQESQTGSVSGSIGVHEVRLSWKRHE